MHVLLDILRPRITFVAMVLAVALLLPAGASAHPELERARPAPDDVIGAPPSSIDLWMTEAVAVGAGSPALSVLADDGSALAVSNVGVDPADPRHITASVSGIGYGVYTVAWSARSDVDGHTLTGTYAFRVGGSSRAPAAATVEGETPRLWAVLTRWLTFLGAGLAAAGLLYGLLDAYSGDQRQPTSRRRFTVVWIAALAGLVATLLEPVLQSVAPPAGVTAPSLSDAVRGLPDAWYLRAPGLAVTAAVALLHVKRQSRVSRLLVLVGAATALVAILGLALTSHASAREEHRLPALTSVITHQWAVALWVGLVAIFTLDRVWHSEETRDPRMARRVSWAALGLAAIGIGTGVVNAGFVLPSRAALVESDYGRVLLVKAAILLVALALAAVQRLAIHRAAIRAVTAMRRTLPAEAIVLALVVAVGSVLALLAPPSTARGLFDRVDLAAPLPAAAGDDLYARLVINPVAQGGNDIVVSVTDGPPVFVATGGGLQSGSVVPDVALARVSLTNLDQSTAPTVIDLQQQSDGTFAGSDITLGLDGWWRADLLIRRLGVEDLTIPFYFILPDPNVHGADAVSVPAGDVEARAIFDRAIASYSTLSSVHFVERLGGGTGTVAVSEHITHNGAVPGQPAALRISAAGFELIRMNGLQWIQEDDGDWVRTDATAVRPIAEWAEDHAAAVGLRLGGQEMVGERAATIITFKVPSETFADAWYAWWVDNETGHVLRETMVSRGHYMVRDFDSFDNAPAVSPPD